MARQCGFVGLTRDRIATQLLSLRTDRDLGDSTWVQIATAHVPSTVGHEPEEVGAAGACGNGGPGYRTRADARTPDARGAQAHNGAQSSTRQEGRIAAALPSTDDTKTRTQTGSIGAGCDAPQTMPGDTTHQRDGRHRKDVYHRPARLAAAPRTQDQRRRPVERRTTAPGS